jgi:hypothetical protein
MSSEKARSATVYDERGSAMDLATVRHVKRELESVFATRQGKLRKFALGVATPAGKKGYRVAVRAAAEEDLPKNSLRILREHAAGEVDVQFVGRISATGAHALTVTRGLAIGASVARARCNPGTLGFFARRVSDDAIGFVSANHILAAEDRGLEGDEIVYPGPPHTVIGRLAGKYPRLNQRNPLVVDCAFAELIDGLSYDTSSLNGGRKVGVTPVAPNLKPDVCKIGTKSGITYGRVTAFELDPVVHYSFGRVQFKNQIEIDSADNSRFSKRGDSGALVFTRDGCNPVGLVFAMSAVGGHANRGLTYANPIDAVLRALGVTFLN